MAARVNRVQKTRDQRECGRCRKMIPVGSPYLWAKQRYGPKMIRCGDPCTFRGSELVGGHYSTALAIQEDAEDALRDFSGRTDAGHDFEGLASALEDISAAVDDLREEISANADSQEEYFPDSYAVEQAREREDQLEQWHDELEEAASHVRELGEELATEVEALEEDVLAERGEEEPDETIIASLREDISSKTENAVLEAESTAEAAIGALEFE